MDTPYKVIYVDDEEMLLDLTRLFLERSGDMIVSVTTSPKEALNLMESGRFDAIISDYEMPSMDGIELLKAVRERDSTFPFLLFTGRGREEVVIRALNHGATFYLQKGGDPQAQFAELAHKVRQAILINRTGQDLKRSLHELRQALSRYETFISASHTGAWEYHADTDSLWCSPEYFSMLGRDIKDYDLSKPGSIRSAWIDLLHPEDRQKAVDTFRSYLDHPEGMYEQYFRMMHADGHPVWIWSRGRTLLDETFTPTPITVGTIIDISKQKEQEQKLRQSHEELQTAYDVIARTGEELRANLEKLTLKEQALTESEEKYRTLFESAGDAIFILDGGVITDCNHQAEVMFRVSKDRLIGSLLADFAPDHQSDGVFSREKADEKNRQTRDGKPHNFEFVYRRNDGTEFYGEVTLQQISIQGRLYGQAIIRDITDRKDAEMELLKKNEELATAYEEILSAETAVRESEERLIQANQDLACTKNQMDNIIAFLPDGTLVIDQDGVVIAWNRAMEEMTGVPADQIIGKSNYEYAIPFYHERRPILIDLALTGDECIIQLYPSVTRRGSAYSSEIFLPHFYDGSGGYFWFIACPFFDTAGHVAGAIECIRDITDRRRIEEALQQTNERLDYAMAAKHEGYWDWNLKTNTTFFDDRYYTMAGYQPKEFPENFDAWQERVHPDDLPSALSAINAYLSGASEQFDIEFRFLRKDGSWMWIEGRGMIVERDPRGKPLRMIGTHTDITSRKKAEIELQQKHEALSATIEELSAAEEELRHQYEELTQTQQILSEREEFFVSLTRTIPGVVYQLYVDPAGTMKVTYVSSRLYDIFGISPQPEDTVFERFLACVYEPDREEFLQSVSDAIGSKSLWQFEGRFIKPSGEEIWFQGIALPIRHDDGIRFHGILLDVSIRKQAEIERYQRSAEREDTLRQLAIMSDSLREANKKLALLSSITRHDILNKVSVLMGYLDLAQDLRIQNDELTVYIQKCTALTADIVRQIEFTRLYQDLGAQDPTWQNLDDILDHLIVPSDIDFIHTPTHVAVFVDLMFVKVLENLIENAVRHGVRAKTITVSTRMADQDLIIQVEDDGIGISDDEKEKIFERGYGKNTGFGLFLAREILSITGISIQETGQAGKGARFVMTVPEGRWRRMEEE